MGFISRKLFPACGSMCVCCPALRSRSRQPVKRYKKLIADIFPKSPDGQPNERKLVKLCEYAAKNPIRIPKITKQLEEKFFRELRYGHLKTVGIVMEAYNKLLCMCGKQIIALGVSKADNGLMSTRCNCNSFLFRAYFAASLLLLSDEVLDRSKEVDVQTDGTYARNIATFVSKVCILARESGVEHPKHSLRASCLQCLSAMIWYMAEFSNIFHNIDEIVQVILDNYEGNVHNEEREEPRHQWVDEVVRCAGGGCAVAGVASPCCTAVRPPPDRKNIASLTKEEIENPRVWAQIGLQRLADLARESSTMRQVLEPMFIYFDAGRHWSTQQGLAVTILCDMCYFMEVPENQQVILNGIIRHMDHKNVAHDPLVKSCVVQAAANVARQIRSVATLSDIGFVGDLLRHLRKSLQSIAGPVREEDINLNIHLQNSIESCLLEIAKGIKDADSLFYLMVIALEKLPPVGVVARATMGSVLILAHVSVAVHSHLQLAFPEALLIQILKAMLHTDTEARVVAHQIFSVLLFPSSWRSYETRRWQSNRRSALASVTDLLDKLRKEKDFTGEKTVDGSLDEGKGREVPEDEFKQGWRRSSPNFYKLSSIIDRTAGTNSIPEETCIMKLSEDQILQLLSGFWIQANLSDNLPSNFEAIAHSYCLMLISSHIKNTNHSIVVRFFQMPLSLRNVSLRGDSGMLPFACRRSMFITSTAMLMFAARMYQMLELNDLLKSQVLSDVDPFLGINEDLLVYVKPQVDIGQYGSAIDNQAAISFLSELREKNLDHEKITLDIIVRHLCCIIKIEEEELLNQLSTMFTPDEAFIFAPKELRELDHTQIIRHLNDSPSLDGELSISSVVEDDVTSSMSVFNISGQRGPHSRSDSHIMSIGQLLESALEVAGQVVGTSVSASPLSYSTMAGQCEALEAGTRKKLSNWLAHDNSSSGDVFSLPSDGPTVVNPVSPRTNGVHGEMGSHEQLSSLRLPPASPFDNFLHAVSGPRPMLAGLSP
uniref:Uncharacterized protein n=1 Tax=Chenopodium quinoa TaxID=63459 RepID=A0A803L4F5_CHEQI